jgi:hypothetical protein
MAEYQVGNDLAGSQQALSSSYKTLVTAVANTTGPRRGKIYDFLIGTNGTPADNYLEWDVSRQTANGIASTFTNATPTALDPADVACNAWGGVNYTTEGTITSASSVFYLGLNQRASYRWVAAPGGELVWPATAWNGFALRAKSAVYTGTATGKVYFDEQ